MSSHISVVGTVATRPNRFATPGRASVCSFRIAANERRYNRESERWEDGDTNWYTVVTFRGLADHAEQSFAVGDRVVVTGRLRVRQWSTAEKSGTSVEIDAEAVGHDVRWGVSSFRKHRSADAEDAGTELVAEEDFGRADPGPAGAGSEDPDAGHTEDQISADGFTPSIAA